MNGTPARKERSLVKKIITGNWQLAIDNEVLIGEEVHHGE
jgi:hypothetical protein